jgi:NAD(P)-dependent dehydrogenase (short-subunit alcohol dehydrogenase family)
VGRDPAKLDAAKAEILASHPGGDVRTASLDVTDEAAVEAFFDRVPAGSVHHLVATVGASASASDITGKDGFAKLKKQFDLKFFAQVRCRAERPNDAATQARHCRRRWDDGR